MTVKVGRVIGGSKPSRIVNIAGGDRYLIKMGVDTLLGNGNYAEDYNLNGPTNLEEIASGGDPFAYYLRRVDVDVVENGKGGYNVSVRGVSAP